MSFHQNFVHKLHLSFLTVLLKTRRNSFSLVLACRYYVLSAVSPAPLDLQRSTEAAVSSSHCCHRHLISETSQVFSFSSPFSFSCEVFSCLRSIRNCVLSSRSIFQNFLKQLDHFLPLRLLVFTFLLLFLFLPSLQMMIYFFLLLLLLLIFSPFPLPFLIFFLFPIPVLSPTSFLLS